MHIWKEYPEPAELVLIPKLKQRTWHTSRPDTDSGGDNNTRKYNT